VSAPASESRIVQSILRLRSNVRRPCAARYEAANQTFYAWLNVPKMPSHDCERWSQECVRPRKYDEYLKIGPHSSN
jgi:hypothetical protein